MTDEREAALTRTDSGLLRAVEAEARRRERIRVADVLRRELARSVGEDRRTEAGRVRYGLQRALDAIPMVDWTDGGPWTELVGSVCSEVDGIDVALNLADDDDGPDPWPFRLKVVDGADDTVAYAYLDAGDVDELLELLTFARKRWSDHLAARPAAPVDNAGGEPAGG